MLEFKRIAYIEKDMWGYWQARVDLGDEGPFIKMGKDKKPTETQVKKAVDQYILNRTKTAEDLKRQELIASTQKIEELQQRKIILEGEINDIA